MPKILFGDDSDGEEQEKQEFCVNESYAQRYDLWRRKEEFQKLKDKYGDADDLNSESSSSSEDDFVEPDNPSFDDEFYKVITALKSRDPKVGEKEFFTKSFAIPSKKEDKEKPMTIRDLERKRLIEKGGQLEDSDEELKDFDKMVGESMKSKRSKNIELMKGKKNSGTVGFEDDGIGGSGDEDNLLTKKNPQTKKKSKKSKSTEITGWEAKDKSEQWLKDFFVNKRYLDSDSDGDDEDDGKEVVVDEETISEDEETLEKMDDFAAKYNFRFLEPDGHTIRSYPREIQGSIREKSNKRKIERDNALLRKKEQKEIRREEIMQLKELKQKEILDKIELLKDISGNENIDDLIGELKEDFDSEKHDKTMMSMFSADYYDEKEDNDQKPVFPDDDEMYKDYDDWIEKNPKFKDEESLEELEEDGEKIEEHEANADADGSGEENSELNKPSTSKRKKSRPKLAEILAQKKRQFDPSNETFEKYYDEFYKLEFEDIVAGMPVRFNYKKVEPNSFGLTTEEILGCKDAELNKWYSMNKILRYDRNHGQEISDAKNYAERSLLPHIKYKYLPSLFSTAPEDELAAEMEKKRLKNRNKKLRKQKKKEAEVEGFKALSGDTVSTSDTVAASTSKGEDTENLSKRKLEDTDTVSESIEDTGSVKKFKGNNGVSKFKTRPRNKKSQKEKLKSNTFLDGISDARLKALGANPKRLRSKMKYKDKANL